MTSRVVEDSLSLYVSSGVFSSRHSLNVPPIIFPTMDSAARIGSPVSLYQVVFMNISCSVGENNWSIGTP